MGTEGNAALNFQMPYKSVEILKRPVNLNNNKKNSQYQTNP